MIKTSPAVFEILSSVIHDLDLLESHDLQTTDRRTLHCSISARDR